MAGTDGQGAYSYKGTYGSVEKEEERVPPLPVGELDRILAEMGVVEKPN